MDFVRLENRIDHIKGNNLVSLNFNLNVECLIKLLLFCKIKCVAYFG